MNEPFLISPHLVRSLVHGESQVNVSGTTVSPEEDSASRESRIFTDAESAGLSVRSVSCGKLCTLILTHAGQICFLGVPPIPSITRRVWDRSKYELQSLAAGGGHIAAIVKRQLYAPSDFASCFNCGMTSVSSGVGLTGGVSTRGTFRAGGILKMSIFTNCHCCGGVYCTSCITKNCVLLQFGYDAKVEVCDKCYEKQQLTKFG